MKKWSEVAGSDEFKALPRPEQEQARTQYFEQVVAPRVDPADVDRARQQFEQDTVLARQPLPEGIMPSSAGAGRGSTIPTQPELPAPPAADVTAYPMGRGLSSMMTSGDNSARQDALDRPTMARSRDPMLRQEYIDRVRSGLADMPEDRRLPYLRNLANGGDAQARAARVLLSDAGDENAQVREATRAYPELVREAAKHPPRMGGGTPHVTLPDLAPTIGELADDPSLSPEDRAPSRLRDAYAMNRAGRDVYGAAVALTPERLQQRATLKERVEQARLERAPEGVYEGTALDNMAGMTSLAGAKGLFQAASLGASALQWMNADKATGDVIGPHVREALGDIKVWADRSAAMADRAQSKEDRAQWQEMSQVLNDKEADPLVVLGFVLTHPRLMARLGTESVGIMAPMVATGKATASITEALAERALAGAAKSPAAAAEMARMAQIAATGGASAANIAMGAGGAYSEALRNGSSEIDAQRAAGATGLGYAIMAKLSGGGAEAALAGGKKTSAVKTAGKEALQEYGESYSESLGAAATPEVGFDAGAATKQAVLEGAAGAVAGGGIGAATGIADAVRQKVQADARARADAENTALFDRYFTPPPGDGGAPMPPTKARSASIERFGELAAAHGLDPDAEKEVRTAAATMPSGDVPGFLTRVTRALTGRGLFAKPVDAGAVQALHATLSPPTEGAEGEQAAAVQDASEQAAPDEAAAATGRTQEVVPGAAGEALDRKWTAFAEQSGTLGIPREQMPQVAAEHRGALVNFLEARGVAHETAVDEDPEILKPAQREFSPERVQKAREFTGGDRAVIVSEDNFILDGTHQWKMALDDEKPIKVIRFNTPIDELIRLTHSFPSSTTARGATPPAAAGVDTQAEPIADRIANARKQLGPAGAEDVAIWIEQRRDDIPGDIEGLLDDSAAAELLQAIEDDPQGTVDALLGRQKPAPRIPTGEATDMLPVGETTEGEPPPAGEATEIPEGEAVSTWLGARAGEDVPLIEPAPAPRAKQLPVGEATEIEPEDVAPAGEVDQDDQRGAEPVAPPTTASWVIREKATGRVIMETFDRKKVDALNTAKYEAVPIQEHLASLNRKPPETPPAPAPVKPRVFMFRKAAEKERDALGNEHKLQKVKGGYILRKKTDKEMAAEARAGRRLAAGASGKRTLLAEIASGGGLNINDRKDTIGEGNRNIGGKMLFTNAGRSIHKWAEKLHEAGWIPVAESEAVWWLQKAIGDEFAGRTTHYALDDTESMDEDLEARRLAAQGDEPLDDAEPLADFDVADLEATGYARASPEVQALTEQLIAEAEALGIDTETIRENAARNTEDTEDEYHAAVQAALKQAIAEAQADAARRNAEAARGSGADRGEVAGDQGEAEGLTPEQLKAAIDALGPQPKGDFEAFSEWQDKKQALRVKAIGPVDEIAIVKSEDGRQWKMILRDASEPGKWRTQTFDADGFSGHEVYNTKEQAISEAASYRYTERDDGALDRLQDTPKFQRGLYMADLIQRLSRKEIDHAELHRLQVAYDATPDDPLLAMQTPDALRAKAEREAEKTTDDFLTELFGTPAEQAKAQEKFEADAAAKKQAVSRIRESIDEQKTRAKSEHDDWAGRVYKANKTQVDLRGDGPSRQDSMSIGSINESRRRRAMEALAQELNALNKLADAVSTDSGAERVLANMRALRQKAETAVASGNWPGIGADEMFESMLLEDMQFRGPGGRGNVTSNGLSRAMLSTIKPDRGNAARPALTLEAQDTESLRAKAKREYDAEAADKAEQRRLEAKARADAQVSDFTLTGSDRAADVGVAQGQGDIFSAAAERPAETGGGTLFDRAKRADGRSIPVEGDEVYMPVSGAFGMPASISGVVVRGKNGLSVKITESRGMLGETTKQRSAELVPDWTLKGEESGRDRAQKAQADRIEADAKRRNDEREAELTEAEGRNGTLDPATVKIGDVLELGNGDLVVVGETDKNGGLYVRPLAEGGDVPRGIGNDYRGIKARPDVKLPADGTQIVRRDRQSQALFADGWHAVAWNEDAEKYERIAPPTLRERVEAMKAGAAKIDDVGEKIGGARKDTAESTGPRVKRADSDDDRPAWARRFKISQIVADSGAPERNVGRWVIHDSRSTDFMGQPRQVGRDTFATKEEAEARVPLAAVAMKHRAVPVSDGKYEIWRDITDRKRVKVVDKIFDTRDEAMLYMAANAVEIIETNTTFGEGDLPLPPDRARSGPERRRGNVTGDDFKDTFGFRGVEFGNWNNQDERQALMNDAWDGLMDLADVLGVPPKALGLNGDLALAFGARGQGLNSARAHYERDRAVINLTKEHGAGSLAHEWLHALDHYFGRQDGKASAEWVTNTDGTRTLKAADPERSYVSHGFRGDRSGVRAELRAAYENVMRVMSKRAEGYVEDTAKVEGFTAATREGLAQRLDSLRAELSAQKDARYYKRNNKPASAEQLAEFDTIAAAMLEGRLLETDWRTIGDLSKPVGARAKIAHRWTNDTLERLSEIYKAVRGRGGFDSTNRSGALDNLRSAMNLYSQRLKMLADAQSGTEKTRTIPTEFAREARELDQGRGTDYWTTPHEMAARAFQGYVEDKIAERGGVSRFLNYAPANAGILTPWGFKRPYPHGDERLAINKAFDAFVSELKTRETDKGVALYEPDAHAYTGGYETDLFGTPLPAVTRANRRAGPDRAGLRGNVQPEPAVPADTQAPPGDYYAPTVVGVVYQRKLGAAKITTPQEAAQATRYLYDSAVERLDGIVTDKNGKPLAVVGGFKGALSQASVYPATIMGEAIRVPGAAHIWFSHNHPSGTASLSRADEFLNQTLSEVFRGSGIEPMGLLAIGGDEYGFIGAGKLDMLGPTAILASTSSATVPAIERLATRPAQKKTLIESPAQAKAAAGAYYTASGGPGLMLLDAQHGISAWVPISPEMRGALRGTGGLNAIYRAVSEANAGAAIIVHGGELGQQVGPGVMAPQNIAAALTKLDVRALDIINAKTGESVAERGGTIADGPVYSIAYHGTPYRGIERAHYSRATAAPTGQNAAALRAALVREFSEPVVKALEDAGLLYVANAPLPGMPASAAGVTSGAGEVGLFAGNIPAGSVAVAYHEALHATLRKTIGAAEYDALMARLSKIGAAARAGSPVDKFFAGAVERVTADTAQAKRAEELAAYAVEQFQRSRETMPSIIRKWVESFVAAIRIGLARALRAANVASNVRATLLADPSVLHRLARDGLRSVARAQSGKRDSAREHGAAQSGMVDAESLGGASYAEAAGNQGLRGLDVPTQRVVLAAVVNALHDGKILRRVVQLVPVNVVNDLAGKKGSANRSLGDDAVLMSLKSVDTNSAIPSVINAADSLVRATTRAIAETGGVLSDFAGDALNGGSAVRAADNDSASGIDGGATSRAERTSFRAGNSGGNLAERQTALNTIVGRHFVTPTSDAVLGTDGGETPSVPPILGANGLPLFSRAPQTDTKATTEPESAPPGSGAALARQKNTPAEIRAAKAAIARIEAAGGVTSPDDLRDVLRVSGYSQWAESSIARDVDATARLWADIEAQFALGKRPVLTGQGVLSINARSARDAENVQAVAELADRYGVPVIVRGHYGDFDPAAHAAMREAGFERYRGLQEVAGRAMQWPEVGISWIRPAGGISSVTPLFSIAPEDQEAPPTRLGLARQARERVADLINRQRTLNFMQSTIGTPFGLSRARNDDGSLKNPDFYDVYEGGQDYLTDVNTFANDPAELAPDVVPILNGWRGAVPALFGGTRLSLREKDRAAIAAPIYDGTLRYIRDEYGQPVEADDDVPVGQRGIVWEPEELRSRYNLTDQQIGMYQQAQAATGRSLDYMASAEVARLMGNDLSKVVKEMVSDGDLGRYKGLVNATLNRAIRVARADHEAQVALAKLIAPSNEAEVARAQKRIETSKQEVVRLVKLDKAVEKVYKRVADLKDRGYFPLMRFGKWKLTIRDSEGKVQVFRLFETQAEMNVAARRYRAAQEFADSSVVTGELSTSEFRLFSGMTPETLALFGELVGIKAEDKPLLDEYIQLTKANHSAMLRMVKRKGREGFSEDVQRTLASFLVSNAKLASKNLHTADIQKAAANIRRDANGKVKDDERGLIADYAHDLVEYIMNPKDEKVAPGVKGFLFFHFIGGSALSAAVNGTQIFMQTMPYIASHSSGTTANRIITKALAQALLKADPNTELGAAMQHAQDQGIISPQALHELRGQAIGELMKLESMLRAIGIGKGAVASTDATLRKFLYMWGGMFSLMEQYNRRVTFIAGWTLARERGMADPIEFAKETVRQTQGDYNRGNRPKWARSDVGQVVMTYTQFKINYMEGLFRLGPKYAAYALVMQLLLSGLKGLPGEDDAEDVLDTIMQRLGGKAWSSSLELHRLVTGIIRALAEPFGLADQAEKYAAPFALHGLSAIPGVPYDLAGRLSMSNLWPGTGLFLESSRGKAAEVLEALGPFGGVVRDLAEKGDIRPIAARNIAQGVEAFRSGELRGADDKLLGPVSKAGAVGKMLGANPQTIAAETRSRQLVQPIIDQVKAKERGIVHDWAEGIVKDDEKQINAAIARLDTWNRKNPEWVIVISDKQLDEAAKRMTEDRRTRFEKALPRDIRGTVLNLVAPRQ